MSLSLGQLREQARQASQAGDYPEALRLLLHILTVVPAEHEARLHVADLLARVGMNDEASAVYRGFARLAVATGHPLQAVVAAHALVALGQPADDVVTATAQLFSAGSPQLVRFAVRPAPPDPAQPVPPPSPEKVPFDTLVDQARARALDISGVAAAPPQFHPLPFLSDLGAPELMAVLRAVKVRRLHDGELCMQQGDPGDALYLLALGEVRVFGTGPDGRSREFARLSPPTLFGEMALLTDQPRTASVAAVGEADVIEVSRAVLAHATAHLPGIGIALDRFARERLMKNLLATSPLFTPFTKQQQADLLQRFEGIEYAPGALIIQQGAEGTGLFVVVAGEVEVVREEAGGTVPLARLHAGEVFGEMSLLSRQPIMATVRAVRPTTALFLPRGYFERLVGAVSELGHYFQELATRRLHASAALLLGRRAVPDEIAHGGDTDRVLI